MEKKPGYTKNKKLKLYTRRKIDQIPQLAGLSKKFIASLNAVSEVLPFKVNNYVIDELIDWNNIPYDPIYQLTFPQPGMLEPLDLNKIKSLLKKRASKAEIQKAAENIQMRLNPHPAEQLSLNVPVENGTIHTGMQHKYDETVLFFPSQGQSCHAFCTYCFRWAQFVGLDKLKFAGRDPEALTTYLENHPEVTDILFTGGDPMTMGAGVFGKYLEPLIRKKPGNLSTIRIGTKALAYWPYRFVSDKDSDDLMGLFEKIVRNGIHLSVMAHFSHYRELETPIVQTAIQRILGTGAAIRCQAPLIKYINDDPHTWATMWKMQVKLGAVPYYMFVERDTGPKNYFKLPLKKACRIFSEAYSQVSGLCRTVRGPSMSATPGKVMVEGITEVRGEKFFALKFIQAREPEWVNKIFFAEYDENASWLDELKPAFGEREFFFSRRLNEIKYKKANSRIKTDSALAPEDACS